jgi:hypothetical protein
MRLQIKITTNQVGTAIDYFSQGDWRCLELFRGELDTDKVRRIFAERAKKHNIQYAEVGK